MDTHKYEKLKELLQKSELWPMLYMFKFIVPNQDNKVKQVADMLPSYGEISYKHTKNLKHVSVTCKAWMKTPEDIIALTEKIEKIEGVMVL